MSKATQFSTDGNQSAPDQPVGPHPAIADKKETVRNSIFPVLEYALRSLPDEEQKCNAKFAGFLGTAPQTAPAHEDEKWNQENYCELKHHNNRV